MSLLIFLDDVTFSPTLTHTIAEGGGDKKKYQKSIPSGTSSVEGSGSLERGSLRKGLTSHLREDFLFFFFFFPVCY